MAITRRKAVLNDRITLNFQEKEFMCRCCNEIYIHPALVRSLEKLRHKLGGKPITINSGYRCQTHNKNVGGAPKSQHMFGLAADITVKGMTVHQVASAAEGIFDGIGKYPKQNFVHVDLRGYPQRWEG